MAAPRPMAPLAGAAARPRSRADGGSDILVPGPGALQAAEGIHPAREGRDLGSDADGAGAHCTGALPAGAEGIHSSIIDRRGTGGGGG